MKTEKDLKTIVKEKYAEIALQSTDENKASCCGAGGCSTKVYNIMTDDYTQIEGYNPEADLGLGCGLPTEFANINKGDIVIDLGSGAGNDCFVAREAVGEEGKVIGIDFTEAMINKARENAMKLNYSNVNFIHADIEDIPLKDNYANVVVSNCVLNLVPNKEKVLSEIYRVLKPGGHFSISDIVLIGILPTEIKEAAEMYAGCVSGAIQKADYIGTIEQTGFKNIQIQKEKVISIPDDILSNYLTETQIEEYKKSEIGIFSITVYAEKV
jgi:arsenite methyltransferase